MNWPQTREESEHTLHHYLLLGFFIMKLISDWEISDLYIFPWSFILTCWPIGFFSFAEEAVTKFDLSQTIVQFKCIVMF